MANEEALESTWLSVIGRSLAYLCLKDAEKDGKFKGVLDRVSFLESLGLSGADAAKTAGSSKASVDELRRRNKRTRGRNAKAKKKTG